MRSKATMPVQPEFQASVPVGHTPRECKWCKKTFHAKQVDIKRGWALFCSKSCKAKAQTAKGRLPSVKPKVVKEPTGYESFSEWDAIAAREDKAYVKRRTG